MKISYVSDLHLDFWVQFSKNQIKWQHRTEEFISKLIETDEGEREVLCIAGDISHFNSQALWSLNIFSQHYKQIYYVLGNHDYYLVSKNQSDKYGNNSYNRVAELIDMTTDLVPNITPLTSDKVFTYKGVSFGGNSMWYPIETIEQLMFFNNVSNDSKYIKGFDIKEEHHVNQKQYETLLTKNVDVMISHFPVINIDSHFKYNSTACYLTSLRDVQASHWIFGHSHEQKVYEKPYCTFYMNAIGYPSEKLDLSIRSFEI